MTIALDSSAEHRESNLTIFWSLIKPWRWILSAVGVSVLLGAVAELAPPLIVKQIVDQHLVLGQSAGLLLLAALYLGSTAVVQVLGFVTEYLASVIAQGVLRRLRVRLFSHLQSLPISYYDKTPLGDTISRCTADMETISTLFTTPSSGGRSVAGAPGGTTGAAVIMGTVRLVTVGTAMIVLSPLLSLVAVFTVVPVVIVTKLFQVRVCRAERDNRRAVGLQNTHLQETLGGIEVIRAQGAETTFLQRFRLALRDGLLAYNRTVVYSAIYVPMMVLFSALAMGLVLWLGVSAQGLMTSLDISLGTLTAFVLLLQRLFIPIMTMGNDWQTVQAALAGLERVFQVLAIPSEAASQARSAATSPVNSNQQASKIQPVIEMKAVSFGYNPPHPVLHDISFEVFPGEQVALVGRTGSGKSSILQLLGGLYTPWSGVVKVSGEDPSSLSEDRRRGQIGVVLQVVQLFRGTVLDNITLGDESIPGDVVLQAAKATGADSFIRSLPQGYRTLIGAGLQLSAGQRQLLALTRALVWQPTVLLLDEATAAIDSASEAALRSALHSWVLDGEPAVLTVAHRLAVAREADRVIVMDAGRIVESGRPEELVRRGGPFAALLELEEAGWSWQENVRVPTADGGA